MNTVLALRMKTIREAKGISQEKLAEKLNIKLEKYLKLEKGLIDFSYSTILSIAKALDINTSDITSAVKDNSNISSDDEKFSFISGMIDCFYVQRKLFLQTQKE